MRALFIGLLEKKIGAIKLRYSRVFLCALSNSFREFEATPKTTRIYEESLQAFTGDFECEKMYKLQ